MKKITSIKWLIVCSISCLIFSCQKDIIEEKNNEINPLIEQIIELGFKEKDIVKLKSGFLVDGCYYFPFEEEQVENKSSSKRNKKGQYRYTNIVSSNLKTIKLFVDPTIPTSGNDNWRPALNLAISAYNNIQNLGIKFQLVSNIWESDITIKSDLNELLDSTLADAQLPQMDVNTGTIRPGKTLRLNLDSKSNFNYTDGQKCYILMHELGHCLGLKHTDYLSEKNPNNGILIPQTPQQDAGSVMLSRWSIYKVYPGYSFSSNDLIALRYLFPVKTIISGPNNICVDGVYTITNPGSISIVKGASFANLNQTGPNTWKVTSKGIGSGEVVIRSTNNNYLYPVNDFRLIVGVDITKSLNCWQLGNGTTMLPGNEYDVSLNPSPSESYIWSVTGAQIISGQNSSSVKIRVNSQIDPYNPNVMINVKITNSCTSGYIHKTYSVDRGPIDIN